MLSPNTSIDLMDNPLPFTREALLNVGARFPDVIAFFRVALEAWMTLVTRF
jgi:hypothetical protein